MPFHVRGQECCDEIIAVIVTAAHGHLHRDGSVSCSRACELVWAELLLRQPLIRVALLHPNL